MVDLGQNKKHEAAIPIHWPAAITTIGHFGNALPEASAFHQAFYATMTYTRCGDATA
ncbi:MAG: hypothetical protein KBH08_05095 [Brachymonas sp.]|jgi:hypothetical protein|nr:hypothetical protein [Brachymonas sp.]MBP8821460.1 hypothetical protein [Brachymonas sp.]